jgi:hypothetical protein
MAALTALTPSVAGVVNAAAAVSASDTIDGSLLGNGGVYLEIINGNASSDTITITDYGTTMAGNQLPSNTYTVTVANGTSKIFWIKPGAANPATGLVTITHTITATVTYKLYVNQ